MGFTRLLSYFSFFYSYLALFGILLSPSPKPRWFPPDSRNDPEPKGTTAFYISTYVYTQVLCIVFISCVYVCMCYVCVCIFYWCTQYVLYAWHVCICMYSMYGMCVCVYVSCVCIHSYNTICIYTPHTYIHIFTYVCEYVWTYCIVCMDIQYVCKLVTFIRVSL